MKLTPEDIENTDWATALRESELTLKKAFAAMSNDQRVKCAQFLRDSLKDRLELNPSAPWVRDETDA